MTEVSALPTLQQLIERLLTLESTARATSHLQPIDGINPAAITPIKSDYKKAKSNKIPVASSSTNTAKGRDETPKENCKGCGRAQHPNGRKNCPAFGLRCNKCHKPNHFATVCLSTSVNAAIAGDEPEIASEDFTFLSSPLLYNKRRHCRFA